MNYEQAMEVFHAAPESLFVMIEQLKMPHTTVCQVASVSLQLQQLVDLCVRILFMW
jgi:hypothetical protein